MIGEFAGSLRFRVSANQVYSSKAVDREPSNMTATDSIGDLLQTQDARIEGCAFINIPHVEGDMVQREKISHVQPSPVNRAYDRAPRKTLTEAANTTTPASLFSRLLFGTVSTDAPNDETLIAVSHRPRSRASACRTTRFTISPAVGRSWIRPADSPAITAAISKSPRSRASR